MDMTEQKITFDASQLEHWADSPDARTQLSQIVRQAVFETVPEVRLIRMPSGSSVNRPGWDGYLEIERGNPWVPDGTSVWEFSCRKDVKNKATEDYNNRTSDPLGVDPSSSTIIFVTARRWSEKDKSEWIEERRREGVWQDMRVLDAEDLATWLEQAPDSSETLLRLMYPSVFQVVENRQEQVLRSMLEAGVSEIRAQILSLRSPAVSQLDESDSERALDSTHRDLEKSIDAARELLGQGLVLSARNMLDGIRNEKAEIPSFLTFRILTNLAICELELGNIDTACGILDDAHSLMPEDQTAIANAAIAAGLRKDFELSIELARKALALAPQDSQATAALMGGLWDTGKTKQLEELVEAEDWIIQDPRCSLLLATIRTHQSRFEEAADLCRAIVQSGPRDAEAHLCLSQCLLQQYQAGSLPLRDGVEPPASLREAEDEASLSIELLETTQIQVRRHQARVARACARILMGRDDDAMADLNVVLAESPGQPDASYNKGLLLLGQGRNEEARAVLESITDPVLRELAILPLADAYLALADADAVVDLLKGNLNLTRPSSEDIRRGEQLLLAEARLGGRDSVGLLLETALSHDPDNHRLLMLEVVRCRSVNDEKGAEDALIRAVGNSDGKDGMAVRVQLGALYESQGRFQEAAGTLQEVVEDDASHPAAVSLLICQYKGGRRREALDLARRIHEIYTDPPREALLVEASILEYIGDIPSMIQRLEEICSRSDSTSLNRLELTLAHYRNGNHDQAQRLALEVNTSELNEEPESLIELAKLKRLLGVDGYLEDAYWARRVGYDNPAVHLGYFGLCQSIDEKPEEAETVGPGCAVLLRGESQERWWHIVDVGEEPRGTYELASEHPLARRLIGHRIGDSISLREGLETLSYEVASIQSKFVRAFQEVTEEFSTLFPEEQGLFRVRVDNIHQVVDQRTKYVEDAETLYKSGRIPLVTFASMIGMPIVEVWRGFTKDPSCRVIFGAGNDGNNGVGAELLHDAEFVVLDMVALLTVHELGLLGHVRERFGSVAVPQPVFAEIQNMMNMIRMVGQPYGNLGKDRAGQRTISKMPEAVWTEWVEYVQSLFELAKSLERIPMYPLLDTARHEDLSSVLTRAGVGAVYAGYEEQGANARSVLVSDDLILSTFGSAEGVFTVNTQGILSELLDAGVISEGDYSSYIERLILMNYSFVRCSPEDVLRRLESNNFMTTDGTRAMLETLEGPLFDEISAVSLGAEIVASLVIRKDVPSHEKILILFMVLTHLWRGRESMQTLRQFRSEVRSALKLAPLQQSQVIPLVDDYIRIHAGPNT